MHDPSRNYGNGNPVDLSEVEEIVELPPNAELILGLGEAVAAADSEDVQQEGQDIHLRFGLYRIRATVTEVVRDPPHVKPPPPRDTSLNRAAERQRMKAILTRLGASQGIDVESMSESTLKGLRHVLERLTSRVEAGSA